MNYPTQKIIPLKKLSDFQKIIQLPKNYPILKKLSYSQKVSRFSKNYSTFKILANF